MGAPLIQIQGLEKRYHVGRQQVIAVRGVDLDLRAGSTLALVGESGCGKSTLGRCVMHLERPSAGQVIFEGMPLSKISAAGLRGFRRRVQMVFQDPYLSLDPRMTVAQIVAEPLAVHGLARGRTARQERVEELLTQVGLGPEALHRLPHEFSGGQRQRIGIARALASDPDFIVADEPVSALDLSVRAQIVNLLAHLQRSRGLGLLFISHDLQTVGHISHYLAVMYLGRVVEQGPTASVISRPSHPYTQALMASRPQLHHPSQQGDAIQGLPDGEPPSPLSLPSGCPFHPRCDLFSRQRNPACEERLPLLRPHGGGLSACHERDQPG